jgi:hypothetical protein
MSSDKITIGNYVVHVNPDTQMVQVKRKAHFSLPSFGLGGITFAVAHLAGMGPKSKFLGLGVLSTSAIINHAYTTYQNTDKIVFDIESGKK